MKKLLLLLLLVTSSNIFSQAWQSKIHTVSGIEYIIEGDAFKESIFNKEYIKRNFKSSYYYNFRFDQSQKQIVMYNRYETQYFEYDTLIVDNVSKYIYCNSNLDNNDITIEVIDNCVYYKTYDLIKNESSIILFDDVVIYY
tara:strand:- start:27371 stop:27793 length:423 start_codon:yes stop_codon:yes gene_type:complete